MVRTISWAVVLLAACGRIGFDELDDVGLFTAVPLPQGGSVSMLAMGPPGEAYAYYRGRGVLRTADGGATWTHCAPESLRSLVVASDGTVYAGHYDGDVFMSRDRCATWTSTNLATDANDLAVDGTTVWAATGAGVQRFDGTGWQLVPAPLTGLRAIDISAGLMLAGSDGGGIMSSTDGVTWTIQNVGLGNRKISDVAIGSSTQLYAAERNDVGLGGFYRSVDGGATWTMMYSEGGTGDVVAVDPTNADHVLFASYNVFLESMNGGMTWMTLDVPELGNSTRYGGAFDAAGSAYLLTGRGLFYRSSTGAFTPRYDGVNAWALEAVATSPSRDQIFWAAEGGLFRSSDGGETFALYSGDAMMRANCTDVIVSASDPGTVFTSGSHIRKSTDGGQTFAIVLTPGSANLYYVQSLASSSTRIFGGTGAQVVYADAPYTTWTGVPIVTGQQRENEDMVVLPDGSVIAVTDEQGVFRSIDNGATFQELVGAPISARRAWAAGDGTLLVGSSDGLWAYEGSTWVSRGLAGEFVPGLLIVDDTWIAATKSNVYVSRDEGATWVVMPGLANKASSALALDRDGNLLVGTGGYGLYRAPFPR